MVTNDDSPGLPYTSSVQPWASDVPQLVDIKCCQYRYFLVFRYPAQFYIATDPRRTSVTVAHKSGPAWSRSFSGKAIDFDEKHEDPPSFGTIFNPLVFPDHFTHAGSRAGKLNACFVGVETDVK